MKGEKREYSWMAILLILAIGVICYFFLNVSYEKNYLNTLIPIIFALLLFFAYKKSTSSFILVLVSGIFFFIAFDISFGELYTGDSPIALNWLMGELNIFISTLVICLLAFYWNEKSNYKNKFPLILFVLYVALWIILSINVKYFDDWKMENYLTIPFILLLLFTFRKFKLSNLSYTLIFVYMTLHIIGTHYTYSEVPFGFWLQSFFDLPRNHYDRLVHFSFGLLLAYPIRELFIRIGNIKGVWSLYFPIDFVLAFSAVYELIEWGVVIFFGGDLGVAYLGTQGDIWDAQKDMFLAGLGSIIAMLVTGLLIWYYNSKGFIEEIRESLRIKSDNVLGEKYLEKYWKKTRK